MPALLDFRGLAGGHRTPSEQRIIATNQGRSTPKFNNLRAVFAVTVVRSGRYVVQSRNLLFLKGSGQRNFGEFPLADLVDVVRTCGDLGPAVLDALPIDTYGALLDHPESL